LIIMAQLFNVRRPEAVVRTPPQLAGGSTLIDSRNPIIAAAYGSQSQEDDIFGPALKRYTEDGGNDGSQSTSSTGYGLGSYVSPATQAETISAVAAIVGKAALGPIGQVLGVLDMLDITDTKAFMQDTMFDMTQLSNIADLSMENQAQAFAVSMPESVYGVDLGPLAEATTDATTSDPSALGAMADSMADFGSDPSDAPAPGDPASPAEGDSSAEGAAEGSAEGSAGDGGAGAGSSVICTVMHQRNYISDEIYAADARYGARVIMFRPELYFGYRRWADTVVRWITADTLLGKFALAITAMIAVPWANAMAESLGVPGVKSSKFGRFVKTYGEAMCALLGKGNKNAVICRTGI
jgi:hypothetical protein